MIEVIGVLSLFGVFYAYDEITMNGHAQVIEVIRQGHLFLDGHDITAEDAQKFPFFNQFLGKDAFPVFARIPHFQLGINPGEGLFRFQIGDLRLELRIRLLVL